MGARYTIGVDFGTLSARAVLVEAGTGREAAAHEHPYEHGVLEAQLPAGSAPLPAGFALQDPADYLRSLNETVPRVIHESGVPPGDIIGIGIDFTSCTMLPAFADGRPLCSDPRFRGNPYAWVHLWKHHGAREEAERLNAIAQERQEAFLQRYGGTISPEWFFPKAWHILNAAPEVYAAADRLIEAGDWVVWQLTGNERRSACAAGYKALWDKTVGFPDPGFFAALDPRLMLIVDEKMSRELYSPGARAGALTEVAATRLGLLPGTPVAIATIDAHAAVPATTVVGPNKMVLVMGTSLCHMVLETQMRPVRGVCGVVEDGIVPGYFGYEAGQAALGDIFAWFVENCVPGPYEHEARRLGVDLHRLLEERAAGLGAGGSGLLALDWWNGNRSVLGDAGLSGLIVGYTLQTKPEEIYLALIEAAAFGTAMIIDAFEEGGVPIEELYACGGLAHRNRLLLKTFADVTGRSIRIAASSHASALGSAMFAAVAAGSQNGGYDRIQDAAAHMARLKDEAYHPEPGRFAVYARLRREYEALHDHFGRSGTAVMHRLREMRGKFV